MSINVTQSHSGEHLVAKRCNPEICLEFFLSCFCDDSKQHYYFKNNHPVLLWLTISFSVPGTGAVVCISWNVSTV